MVQQQDHGWCPSCLELGGGLKWLVASRLRLFLQPGVSIVRDDSPAARAEPKATSFSARGGVTLAPLFLTFKWPAPCSVHSVKPRTNAKKSLSRNAVKTAFRTVGLSREEFRRLADWLYVHVQSCR
jgi:hypothetical protein